MVLPPVSMLPGIFKFELLENYVLERDEKYRMRVLVAWPIEGIDLMTKYSRCSHLCL